jgi:hypothetical protein
MTESRKPGRPRLKPGEASTCISVRVTVSDFDRACKLASRDRVSLGNIFRRAFRLLPEEARDDDES